MSFIPCTPAGTLVIGLAADTREEAIRRWFADVTARIEKEKGK